MPYFSCILPNTSGTVIHLCYRIIECCFPLWLQLASVIQGLFHAADPWYCAGGGGGGGGGIKVMSKLPSHEMKSITLAVVVVTAAVNFYCYMKVC